MPESASLKETLRRAIALHGEGNLTGALTGYKEVLDADPRQPDALQLLGVAKYQLGDTAGAIEQIRQSLDVNPRQFGALQNLGRIYAETEQWDDAIQCFEQALEIQPDDAVTHRSLGHVLSNADRDQDALQHYDRALELNADCTESRLNRADLLEKTAHREEAIAELRTILERDAACVIAYRRLGGILRKAGRLEEAAEVYDRWLDAEPENPIALHFKAACSGRAVPERASDHFLRATFDEFAAEFDDCLTRLEYRVPQRVGEVLARVLGEPRGDLLVADVGCGTGLCGKYLRPYAATLDGIDLSPGMLEGARSRNLYDKLHEAELTAYLTLCNGDYDLIVSADTFNYLGDLRGALEGAAAALRPGGMLLFSVEELQDASGEQADYRLHRFGRYAHRESYLRSALVSAGLELVELTREPIRTEGGVEVDGFLVLARVAPP